MTLSVCMIVKDEEKVLDRSLGAAASFADEIIVVDTGSADSSREIAGKYTECVYEYEWQDDFAAARNYSYSLATSDYIMWLDADDVILPEDIQKIKELKLHLSKEIDVVCMLYGDLKDDTTPGTVLMRDRWIRRSLNARWRYAIHEAIPVLASYLVLSRPDIRICHDKLQENEPERNLRIFEQLLMRGEELDPYHQSYYCRELTAAKRYEEAIAVYERLIQEKAGEEDVHYARFFYVEAMKHLKQCRRLKEELLHEIEDLHMRCDESQCCFLGCAAMHLKEYDEAREWYQKALSVEIDYTDYLSHHLADAAFEPYMQLALLEAKTGNIKKGKLYFHKAKELYPKNIKVLVNQAYFERQKCLVPIFTNGAK